jgi:hypothetical protein
MVDLEIGVDHVEVNLVRVVERVADNMSHAD